VNIKTKRKEENEMSKTIGELIERGCEIVTTRHDERKSAVDARYKAEVLRRLNEWEGLMNDVRDQLPEVLHEYLSWPMEDRSWVFEGIGIFGDPKKYGEDIQLNVPGLAEINIRVEIMEGMNGCPLWSVKGYEIKPASISDYDPPKGIIYLSTIEEALYCAKVQAQEKERLQAEYDAKMREFEERETLGIHDVPVNEVLDVEKILIGLHDAIGKSQTDSDMKTMALIAIGWSLMEIANKRSSHDFCN
jgi:hypothetical protein